VSNFVEPLSPAQLEYRRYLRSPRWRLFLRPLRVWMDGKRCRVCNSPDSLEVHHRSYTHRGRSWWRELLDLTTLCEYHHNEAHNGDDQ
jgi:5-methylcytosine-specific restriction endonuclease McrA